MAAVRGLLAFWAGGAGSEASSTPVGVRSLLAPWAGGASSVAPTTDAGVRSLLAFWAGGAANDGDARTSRDWKRSDYEALKRPQLDPVRVDGRLQDDADELRASAYTKAPKVAAALAQISVAAQLQDEPDRLDAEAATYWPAVSMLVTPAMVRTPKMIRTPRMLRS